MSFNRCPVCLSKDNGPFVGIDSFAFEPLNDGTQLYGFGAVNCDGDCCCSIGGGFRTLEAAKAAAIACDHLEVEADTWSEAGMWYDDSDYGPVDSDPYDC
jgi:hypothetical protein